MSTPEGKPITELLSSYLLPEQAKVLEQYQIQVEQVWIESVPFSKLLFPEGSIHQEDLDQGPTVWSVVLPGGMKVPHYNLGKFYVVLLGNER